MLKLLVILFMIWIFGKILILSVKASWGILKILFSVIILPLILIGLLVAGIVYVALPILLILGLVVVFASDR